jgi:hypothetical protein
MENVEADMTGLLSSFALQSKQCLGQCLVWDGVKLMRMQTEIRLLFILIIPRGEINCTDRNIMQSH